MPGPARSSGTLAFARYGQEAPGPVNCCMSRSPACCLESVLYFKPVGKRFVGIATDSAELIVPVQADPGFFLGQVLAAEDHPDVLGGAEPGHAGVHPVVGVRLCCGGIENILLAAVYPGIAA